MLPLQSVYGVGLSGILGGMGGLIYILPISTEFTCSVDGYGFLALAVLIFGNWAPASGGDLIFTLYSSKTEEKETKVKLMAGRCCFQL